MIFKLFLNDLNGILSEIYEKIINYDEKKNKIFDCCCYKKCNSVQQKEE